MMGVDMSPEDISPELRAYINDWLDKQEPVVVTPKGYGANAHFRGKPIEVNPYPEGTADHDAWRDGWLSHDASVLR